MRTSLRGRLDRTADLYLRIRAEGEPDETVAWRWAAALVRALDHAYAEEAATELFVADVMADIASIPTHGGTL